MCVVHSRERAGTGLSLPEQFVQAEENCLHERFYKGNRGGNLPVAGDSIGNDKGDGKMHQAVGPRLGK